MGRLCQSHVNAYKVNYGARWLAPPRRAQFQALYALVDELQMPLAELALRFVLSNPAIATVLMGARSVEEVEASVAAAQRGPGRCAPAT